METVRRPSRSTLFWVIVISAAAHGLAGLGLASWKIYRYSKPPEATFTSPPPATRVPPADLAYRVQMQQLQHQSIRPPPQTAGRSESLLNQSLATLDAPGGAFGTSALHGTPVVAGAGGLGRGLGGFGGGGGRLEFGVSAVDFFGIKKQGERVVFMVDAGASMVEPERGDLPGYDRVKRELVGMIERLSPGTFFNIIVFARDIDVYAPRLVVATADNTTAVPDWIAPYWRLRDGKIEQRGAFRKNYLPEMADWNGAGGSSRMDLALAAALEMRADLIFMITDGTPSIRQGRHPTDEERWRQQLERYEVERERFEQSSKGQQEMAAYAAEHTIWRANRDRVIAERETRGLPPVVREGGSRGAPSRPGPARPSRPARYYELDDLVRWVRQQARRLYENEGSELPSINIVGYSPDAKGEAVIEVLARLFPGGSARMIGKFDAETTH